MKFLESPMQTMGVGFALAVVLIMAYLGVVGIGAGDPDCYAGPISWPGSPGSGCCISST
jgi:hypothetical protein